MYVFVRIRSFQSPFCLCKLCASLLPVRRRIVVFAPATCLTFHLYNPFRLLAWHWDHDTMDWTTAVLTICNRSASLGFQQTLVLLTLACRGLGEFKLLTMIRWEPCRYACSCSCSASLAGVQSNSPALLVQACRGVGKFTLSDRVPTPKLLHLFYLIMCSCTPHIPAFLSLPLNSSPFFLTLLRWC